MNHKSFDTERIALGYANRPWIHKAVIEEVKKEYPMKCPFKNGLDMGCGAGLSTKALRLICNHVTGSDISEAMINVCRTLYTDSTFNFYVSSAEKTREPKQKYDIVTAAGMVNWVDKDLLLDRMHEVMQKNGFLIIYDFWITDRMTGKSACTDWYNNQYLKVFPKPPRKENVWQQEEMGENFRILKQTVYEVPWIFTLEQFIDFMMIQSNVNARIESGEKTVSEVYEWMKNSLSPIFDGTEQTLWFDGYCWYIEHK